MGNGSRYRERVKFHVTHRSQRAFECVVSRAMDGVNQDIIWSGSCLNLGNGWWLTRS